jgi:hypothetical protein
MSRLPVVAFSEADESSAIATIAGWIDCIAAKISTEQSRRAVRDQIKDMLQSGTLPRLKAVELAREYADVDAALREHVIEMMDRGEQLPKSLEAFVMHSLAGTTPRGRGRNLIDNFKRDVGFGVLLFWTHMHFGVPLTRNRESRRGDRYPSACSLLAKALNRDNRFPLTEKTLQDQIWYRLGTLAARLEAALPLDR